MRKKKLASGKYTWAGHPTNFCVGNTVVNTLKSELECLLDSTEKKKQTPKNFKGHK